MNINKLTILLAATSLSACSFAPGPYLDSDRLDQTTIPQRSAERYVVRPIDVAYFRQERAAYKPAVCPLTCLTQQLRKQYEYHIGIGDQLTIIVWDHPELTGTGFSSAVTLPPLPPVGQSAGATGISSAGAGGTTGPSANGAGSGGGGAEGGLTVRVAANGTIFFPRVGRLRVTGKSVQQIQEMLTHSLARTIRDPQIDVRVSGYNSQTVQVTGNLRNPTLESITDSPLTVLDAINRAGGAQPDADLQNVGVTRNGKRYTVDVAALLDTGDTQQNVLLQDGDIIDVPDRSNSRVFVLGEVMKPTSLPMNRGRLTLADAMTGAGSLDTKTGDPRYVYVIRGADKTLTPDVYCLDMTQVDALMLMTKFELQPKDVVYVQVASSARFNRALEQISPTLQTLFFTRELTR
ncbi:polysaccharide biosynthesis/export family protein [Paraburkholderia flava]|uniref:polysaccharide biosynthesis/export family protein n=1 Tax=Paraburkholderia flava TaxID=2547393 RepID=UPI00105BAA0B|nr:polysaccharide biosynthesis/export family protein [Paraburkholderia flava]